MTDELVERLVREFERIQGYKGDEHRMMARAAIAVMPRIEALVEAVEALLSRLDEVPGYVGLCGWHDAVEEARAALQGESEATSVAPSATSPIQP